MKIVIAGGSGFIGQAITKELLRQQHDIYILTRSPAAKKQIENVTYIQWLGNQDEPEIFLDGVDVFINLAGESLNSGRWTQKRKQQILNSRITTSKEIIRIISVLEHKPKALLNASAIGYYGVSNSRTYTEKDIVHPTDFLSETVSIWEKESLKATEYGVRTVLMRFGLVLDKKAGALPKMVLPYKMLAGGKIGEGNQLLSWIHIDDVVQATLFCIQNEEIDRAVNFTAPFPENMQTFGKTIASILNKPHWIPLPSGILKIGLGEMSTLLLDGQKVLPKKLEQHGYVFIFPTLETALSDILI